MHARDMSAPARFQAGTSVSFEPIAPCDSTLIETSDGSSKGCKLSMVNAMTVDVEDYYQVSAFDPYVNKNEWISYASRVEANIDRILDMFASRSVLGTFFILGHVAEQHPEMVRRITSMGHEIASHGWKHYRVTSQTQQQFAEDVRKTKVVLEDISGHAVKGYRAASYSVSEKTLWAHEELAHSGHLYSSSIVPIKHDHYGIPDAPRFPFRVNPSGLLEIPVSTINWKDKNYPCGGGGWFRLYPYKLSQLALSSVIENDNRPCVFYFHPWEVDPDQPRVKGLDMKTRFRHYVNLKRMQPKLEALLDDAFNWGRMDDIYLGSSATMRNDSLTNM